MPITYADKSNLNTHPSIPEVNKFTAENANEIKEVVNSLFEGALVVSVNNAPESTVDFGLVIKIGSEYYELKAQHLPGFIP